MQKWIVTSLLGVALASAAYADDIKTGPGTTALTAATPARGDDAFTQQHIATEMDHLTARLSLTPSQQVAVKAAMEGVVHGTGRQSVNQVVRQICDAKQLAAWEQIIAEDRAWNAAQGAAYESHRISQLVGLDAAKQEELRVALYPIELRGRNGVSSVRTAADIFAFDAAQLRDKEAALAKILTPAQMVTYRLDHEGRVAEAAANVKASMDLAAAKSYPVNNTTSQVTQPTFNLTGYVEP